MSNMLADTEKIEDWRNFLEEASRLVREGGKTFLFRFWFKRYVGLEILLELLKDAKRDVNSFLTSDEELKREIGKLLSE